MNRFVDWRGRLALWCLVWVGPLGLVGKGGAQGLTVEVGVPPVTPAFTTNVLVSRAGPWKWRPGTNEPAVQWRTMAESSLDASWRTGAGGFGYGDSGIQGEATTLTGMNEHYTSLYLRRDFESPPTLPTDGSVVLRVDFDDGFVAYLDGTEIARINAPGAPKSPVKFNDLATGSHEASCCTDPTTAPTNLVVGIVSDLLPAGPHVLSFIGLNRAVTNGDFHLIPDLWVQSRAGGGETNLPQVVNYGLYAVSTTNQVGLKGSNTVAGTARVVVDGWDAAWDSVTRTWSRVHSLRPGLNRLSVAALDADGRILTNQVQDVVYQTALATLSGTINEDRNVGGPGTVIDVTADVAVASGAHLTVSAGTVVRLASSVRLTALAGGHVSLSGEREQLVWLLPTEGANWGELAADGAGSSLHIRHAEITRGAVKFRNGAEGVMEDTYHHHYKNGTVPIAGCTSAKGVVIRRCHFQVYHETLWQSTPMIVEDSLFEDADNASSDALDFDTAPPGSVIRRCTFRRGPNTNTDACDIGSESIGVVIENCLMHDFPNDKGVSIGENSFSIVVRNNLMWRNDSGVAVKDSCTAIIEGNTIVDCDFGFRLYNKANPSSATGGGHITNAANNLVWGNRANFEILNGSTMVATYSDLQDTNYPGVGNLSVDPLFLDPALRDYRLQEGSPLRGAGSAGRDIGVLLPVGGIGVAPVRLAAANPTTNSVHLFWEDRTDNEDATLIERSSDGITWQVVGSVGPEITQFLDEGLPPATSFWYRVAVTNQSGLGPASQVARGTTRSVVTDAGGRLTADTVWSGTVLVHSNVVVPGPFTLTVQPGALVRLSPNSSLSAVSGGHIVVNGAAAAKVRLEPTAAGTARWGDLSASGAGSSVALIHGVVTRGRVRASSGGTALIEDSELSQMPDTGIIGGNGGAQFTVRRTHVHDYEDIDLVNTVTLAEDSLFERANSDVFELQNSPPGSVLRRCVFRDCLKPNSDGVDMNGCRDVRIESCQVYRVTDKGISSGSATSASDPTSTGLVVSNTVVYQAAIGIAIKDAGTASVYHSVFTEVAEGIAVYAKFTAAGGRLTAGEDNIIWGVTNAVRIEDGGVVNLTFSDVQGGWNGVGNIDRDPLWRDPANADFALRSGSPCRGAGRNGADMGLVFAGAETDSDGDGMPDDFETLYQLDPRDPADAAADADGDGMSNLAEFLVGTNPRSEQSRLRLGLRLGEDGRLVFTVEAQPGIRYRLESAATVGGEWRLLTDLGTVTTATQLEHRADASAAQAYFRITAERAVVE